LASGAINQPIQRSVSGTQRSRRFSQVWTPELQAAAGSTDFRHSKPRELESCQSVLNVKALGNVELAGCRRVVDRNRKPSISHLWSCRIRPRESRASDDGLKENCYESVL
jgi:hypothetical protein